MNSDTSTNDMLHTDDFEPRKMSSGLNVLTILTFIGCSIFGLFTLFMPQINKFLLEMMDKAKDSGKDFSAKELADMEKGRAAILLTQQNLIPLMIIGLIGIALCFMGALRMRKLKKDGYWLYVVGELAPIVAVIIIMGTSQLEGVIGILLNIGVPLTFVILYTLQRKHLIR